MEDEGGGVEEVKAGEELQPRAAAKGAVKNTRKDKLLKQIKEIKE